MAMDNDGGPSVKGDVEGVAATPSSPSVNGPNGNDNGRDSAGRFTKGCPGGPGNPCARRVAKFRFALLKTVTEEDLITVARLLMSKAIEGEPWAIRELLDRLLGKPVALDVLQQDEITEADNSEVKSPAELVAAMVESVTNGGMDADV